MIDFSKKDKFYEDSIDKQLSITSGDITLGNADLYSESFELNQSICSTQDLSFGAESSQVKFRIKYDVPSLIGRELNTSMSIDGATLPLGKYTVAEDRPNGSRNYRDVVGYDAIYTINSSNLVEWYRTLTFPIRLSDFATSLFAHFGLTIENPITTNGDYLYENSIANLDTLLELPGAKVLNDLANATASFIQINHNGNVAFIQLKRDDNLYPSHTLYPSPNLFPKADSMQQRFGNRYYISCTHEDYLTKKIGRVQIVKEDGDIGVSAYTEGNDNTYTIMGNMFLIDEDISKMQTACNNIFNAIKDIEYTPCELVVVGNPCLECGDLIAFNSHGTTHKTYILQRTIKGIQFLKDTLVAEGNEEISETDNSLRNQVIKLNGKSNVLKTTLDATISELTDFEGQTSSRFEQTASDISAKVSKVGGEEFSWDLQADHFDLFSTINGNKKRVFHCDKDGITVDGTVTAQDLALSGGITINGENILQDSMDANRLKPNTLSLAQVTAPMNNHRNGAIAINRVSAETYQVVFDGQELSMTPEVFASNNGQNYYCLCFKGNLP